MHSRRDIFQAQINWMGIWMSTTKLLVHVSRHECYNKNKNRQKGNSTVCSLCALPYCLNVDDLRFSKSGPSFWLFDLNDHSIPFFHVGHTWKKDPLFISLAVELVCSQVYHFLPLIFQYFHCSPRYTSPIIQQSWSMWNRDGFRASWLNHTPAEEQRLQDNCWSVKVESCGSTVLRSYDSRFLWWESFVFLLNDLLILPQAEPPNNFSQTIYPAWNLILTLKKSSHWKYVNASFYSSFQYGPSFSLLLPFFSGYHSISKAKSVLIGSRGLGEALCQRWWGSWLVQRHRQPTDPLLVCRSPLLAR